MSRPEIPWGQTLEAPGKYLRTRPAGKRVPGWEDTNVSQLATDLGLSFRYLLAVLSGQRNCTLGFAQHVSVALGIELTELINRMERAFHLRLAEAAATPCKAERRLARSERRALESQGM